VRSGLYVRDDLLPQRPEAVIDRLRFEDTLLPNAAAMKVQIALFSAFALTAISTTTLAQKSETDTVPVTVTSLFGQSNHCKKRC
jgi:hypothetical protein